MKAIVNSACRGEKYLTVLAWYRVTHLWRLLCPEVLEWSYCLLFMAGTGDSPKDAYGKKILNVMEPKNYSTLIPSKRLRAKHINLVCCLCIYDCLFVTRVCCRFVLN